MIRCYSFNYVALLHSLLSNVSAHRGREWVTMAAVYNGGRHGSSCLLIDMCLVLDLCVGVVLTYRRSKINGNKWSIPTMPDRHGHLHHPLALGLLEGVV